MDKFLIEGNGPLSGEIRASGAKNAALRVREAFVRAPAVVQGLALAGVALCLHAVAGAKAEPFVYGQF